MLLEKVLEDCNIRGIVRLFKHNFPLVIVIEKKKYEIRYTPSGGLVMRKYEERKGWKEVPIQIPDPQEFIKNAKVRCEK